MRTREGFHIQSLQRGRPSVDSPYIFVPLRAIQGHDTALVRAESIKKCIPRATKWGGCGIPSTTVSDGSSSMKHRLSLRSM
jgi:hypothetical protein